MIKKALYDDLEEILSLQKLAYQSEALIYDDYNIPPLTQSVEEIKKDYEDQVFLKKIIEDKIAGSVRAYAKNDICHIGRLIVHPDYQNQGIGKELMKSIEDYFFSCCDKYSLFTGKKSEKNVYLYESLGYIQIKKKKLNDKVTLIFLEKINK